jgi:membrane protein DedA with SNARE-associated domain
MVLASASGVTIGLIITFGGIGVIVNGLIVYIVAQALGERAQNRRRSGADEPA